MLGDLITYTDPNTGKRLATITIEMADDGETLHIAQIINGPSRTFMTESPFHMSSAKFRCRAWVESELDKIMDAQEATNV